MKINIPNDKINEYLLQENDYKKNTNLRRKSTHLTNSRAL